MTIKTASVSEQIFTCYGTLLMKKPAKAVVLLATLTLTGFGIWGNILMEQEFDPSWFLTPDSYLYNWTAMNRKYFPNVGDRVTVWFSGVDFVHELEEVHALSLRLPFFTFFMMRYMKYCLNSFLFVEAIFFFEVLGKCDR